MNSFITTLDFILAPFYLLLIYLVAYRVRRASYPPGHPWRPYFIPGLTAKLFGAIAIGLIYQYYYGSGDTAVFFRHAKVINSSLSESVVTWLNLLFRIPEWHESGYYSYTSQLIWYETANNYFVGSLAAFLGIFTFTTYLPTSLLFAALSYTGIWAIFRTFARQYPHLIRPIALATLFIPSLIIWGSGIFKDTVCMFGLGWLLYGTFDALVQRNFKPTVIALAILGFYLVAIIKVYILTAFLPALLIWVFFTYSYKLRNGLIRFLLTVVTLGFMGGSIALYADELSSGLGQYSTENLLKTSTIIREYIYSISGDEGSAYSLGTIEPTVAGMLKKFPQAVNVSLFRPYIWEARKPIVVLNAIEASCFLWVALRILFLIGPVGVWRIVRSDPNIQFCLIFTIIFAFAVGISSYNFGALSRYRIPCLPTFAMALVLIFYKHFPASYSLFGFGRRPRAADVTGPTAVAA